MKLTFKQCKALIEDLNFVEKHFSRLYGREQQLTVITEASADSNSSSGLKVSCIGMNILHGYPVKAVFECHVILVWVMKTDILILNLLLRRGKLIKPVPPLCGYDYCDYVYGLGYLTNPSSSNGYKIVKFSCDSNRKLDLWVYDFKPKSWNEVFDKSFDGFFNFPMSSVCLRGTAYWIGICTRGISIYSIQSFDFEREWFEPLSLPPTTFEWGHSLSFGVFKVDYISLLHQ